MRNEFQPHLLNALGLEKADMIAEEFSNLLNRLETAVGQQDNAREVAIVKTKLQEACFYAKRAMAVNPLHQQVKK
jgi:hypothetical protein